MDPESILTPMRSQHATGSLWPAFIVTLSALLEQGRDQDTAYHAAVQLSDLVSRVQLSRFQSLRRPALQHRDTVRREASCILDDIQRLFDADDIAKEKIYSLLVTRIKRLVDALIQLVRTDKSLLTKDEVQDRSDARMQRRRLNMQKSTVDTVGRRFMQRLSFFKARPMSLAIFPRENEEDRKTSIQQEYRRFSQISADELAYWQDTRSQNARSNRTLRTLFGRSSSSTKKQSLKELFQVTPQKRNSHCTSSSSDTSRHTEHGWSASIISSQTGKETSGDEKENEMTDEHSKFMVADSYSVLHGNVIKRRQSQQDHAGQTNTMSEKWMFDSTQHFYDSTTFLDCTAPPSPPDPTKITNDDDDGCNTISSSTSSSYFSARTSASHYTLQPFQLNTVDTSEPTCPSTPSAHVLWSRDYKSDVNISKLSMESSVVIPPRSSSMRVSPTTDTTTRSRVNLPPFISSLRDRSTRQSAMEHEPRCPHFMTVFDAELCVYDEHGQKTMFMEKVNGKLQIVAGTVDSLFLKLADDTAQDLDYIDAYLMSHASFITSMELLERLVNRFQTDSAQVQSKRSIQLKVLTVLSRWITLQFQDFRFHRHLRQRLESFISIDLPLAGFMAEATRIKESLSLQMAQYDRKRISLVVPTPFSTPLPSPPRRPSGPPTLRSFVTSLNTPPESPTFPSFGASSFLSLDNKDVAQYLTLADFYLFKCITAYDLLRRDSYTTDNPHSTDYISLLTHRANMQSQWVSREIASKSHKQRRSAIRKFIDIAKLCLEWNNFHTCMLITMALMSASIQKSQEWNSLSHRERDQFASLQALVDVRHNMGAYRQALSHAKAPAVPFLPVVLKDLTFFLDGNQTWTEDGMLNFSKCIRLSQFANTIINFTMHNYWFALDLENLAFLPETERPGNESGRNPGAPLDLTAEVIESRIVAVFSEEGHCK